MPEVRHDGEIPAPVEDVWKLVGDFGGLVESFGIPVEVEGAGVGAVRRITVGSNVVVERLEELDDDARRIRYAILEPGPLPVSNYVATMELSPSGDDATTLTWSSTFEPLGASEEDSIAAVRGIYTGGVSALQQHFGS